MTDIVAKLKETGLTDKEIEVYILLLKFGSVTSGGLIKDTGYYSKTVYEILDKLMGKGLVSYIIKSNRRFFEAVDPERFLDILKEQEIQIKNREHEIAKIIPELKAMRKLNKELQEANIYTGQKGLKSIFGDQLKQGKELFVFGGGGKFKKTLKEYYEIWQKRRVKGKIKLNILLSEEYKALKEDILKFPFTELKFLPPKFDNPAPAILYNDKVAITIWSETPIAILIRNQKIARSYKSYFELLWNIAKNKNQFIDEPVMKEKKKLTKEQHHILIEKGTEIPFTGKLLKNKEKGAYVCAGCGNKLFSSEKKYDSGTGWPSFSDVKEGAVKLKEDNGLMMKGIEVVCGKCNGHLGHLFSDGPKPTGKRYCINSLALKFKEKH